MIGKGIEEKGVTDNYYLFTPARLTSVAKISETANIIVVASMAQIAYPTIIAEMEEPTSFQKALAIQQIVTLTIVNAVAIFFYLKDGQSVESPAFGSVDGTSGKAAYGCVSLSIIICGVIAATGKCTASLTRSICASGRARIDQFTYYPYVVASKGVYEQIWRSLGVHDIYHEKSWQARTSWYGCNLVICGAGLVAAWGIPNFSHIFGLMGSLFGTQYAICFPAIFALQMLRADRRVDEPAIASIGTRHEEAGLREPCTAISTSSGQAKVGDDPEQTSVSTSTESKNVSVTTSMLSVQWISQDSWLRRRIGPFVKLQKVHPIRSGIFWAIFILGIVLVSFFYAQHFSDAKQFLSRPSEHTAALLELLPLRLMRYR